MKRPRKACSPAVLGKGYNAFAGGIGELLESARRVAARATNAVMTATYWEIGRRIVEFEQKGRERATYGEELLARLSGDLTRRHGRGFGVDTLQRMRAFFLTYPAEEIYATPLRKSLTAGRGTQKYATLLRKSPSASGGRRAPVRLRTLPGGDLPALLAARFPLSWSHYIHLLTVKDGPARAFYEAEALRGGWTVRQLNRQIGSMFYERTALSRNKAAMLAKGSKPKPEDAVTAEQEIKEPYVLEFLGLKDEYSESDIEEALIRHLEGFLLELGGDFTFVGRQQRLRIGSQWFRIDLLFYHRRLRCLVVIDLKLDEFTHADAGQMHMYLNYAREHWTHADENPPVGLILCAQKDAAIAKYALQGLPNKIVAAEYRTTLPNEKQIAAELTKTRRLLESRRRD